MVVESDARARRDTQRTAEIIDAAETRLLALEHRVRAGRLNEPRQDRESRPTNPRHRAGGAVVRSSHSATNGSKPRL